MEKTLLFVETDAEVTPRTRGVEQLASALLERSVVVRTPSMIGGGVILGDKIITSLFLVANHATVYITFPGHKKVTAFVTEKDQKRNLARLEPACLADDMRSFKSLASALQKMHPLRSGGPRAIGDPLLVPNVRTGVPKLKVAGMKYSTHLSEMMEYLLKFDSCSPSGLIGNGVWNEEGELTGIAMGKKDPSSEELLELAIAKVAATVKQKKKKAAQVGAVERVDGPNVYALPASVVFDFLETS